MPWITAAQGTSFNDLAQVIEDRELKKGTGIKAEIEVLPGFSWIFDVAGAELVVQPFIPNGVDLIDVRAEGGKGFIDMEADPIWLVALVGFVKANWVALAIAGVVIAAVILSIKLLIKVETTLEDYMTWILLGLGAFGLLYLFSHREALRSRKGGN